MTPAAHGAGADRRLVVSGSDHAMIREDEQLRTAPASVLDRTG
ncbi:hypothetical protein ACWER6_33560 [Streptomyces sp. NPDC004009]